MAPQQHVDAVLILGGCGHVGRHLVELLVKKACCQKIRVVDKVMPMMANLAPDHKAAFESPLVEFKQADLSRQTGVDKAFDGIAFTFVFNLTFDAIKSGLDDATYQQLVVDVSTRCGMAAAQRGAARFVDLSTAQVYEPSDKGSPEKGGKLKPWTKQATYKLRAEATLRDVPGLNLVVLPVYRHLNEKMKFAWDGKLRCNTVHVRDVAAACWHVATLPSVEGIYNVADQSDSSQASLAANLESIFNIQTGFVGSIASTAMKALGLKKVAEDFNDKHMSAWQEMCQKAAIAHTTLTPYIDAELLAHNHLACDGKLLASTGFSYAYPLCTADALKEQVVTYISQGLFPPIDGSALPVSIG